MQMSYAFECNEISNEQMNDDFEIQGMFCWFFIVNIDKTYLDTY